MNNAQFKEWRLAIKANQNEAATILGIARRTLQGYESGETSIPHVVDLACRYIKEKRGS